MKRQGGRGIKTSLVRNVNRGKGEGKKSQYKEKGGGEARRGTEVNRGRERKEKGGRPRQAKRRRGRKQRDRRGK